MLPGPVYLLSDAHIGVAPAEVERDLVGLLRSLPAEAGALVINGDLFDFWFEWRHVIPRVGIRVLGELARLVDGGLPVLWIAGNHDCWGGDVLSKDIGVTYHVGPWRGSLGGWDTLIEHGDGLRDVEDAPYRRLRRVLRHPWAIRAYGWLHPNWATSLALGSSHTSRNYRPSDGGEGLRKVAHAVLASADAPELLVYGHSHVSTLERSGRGVFANPGAFLDGPRLLRVEPSTVSLCRWSAAGIAVEQSVARA
jgi:UDP-2,3-diacylglucosamine hydrolase